MNIRDKVMTETYSVDTEGNMNTYYIVGTITAITDYRENKSRIPLYKVEWDNGGYDWLTDCELTVIDDGDSEEDLVEAYLNERKWYNFETCFVSLRDELRKFMHDNHITYELSSCGCGYHFEILLHPTEVDSFNDWLDAHTITEVK